LASILGIFRSNHHSSPVPAARVEDLESQQRLVRLFGSRELGLVGAFLPYEKIKVLAKCFAIIDHRGEKKLPLALRHPACFIINGFNHLAQDEQSQQAYLRDRIKEICETKNSKVTAALLSNQYIANALRKIPLSEFAYKKWGSEPFVVVAARNGHLAVIHALFKDNAVSDNYSHEAQNRGTALMSAAGNGHVEVVKELLGGSLVIPWLDRGYAVMDAARNGHDEVVRELLKGGLVITQEKRKEALSLAFSNKYYGVIRELLRDAPTSTRMFYLPILVVLGLGKARR
jgi:hypothetical protein